MSANDANSSAKSVKIAKSQQQQVNNNGGSEYCSSEASGTQHRRSSKSPANENEPNKTSPTSPKRSVSLSRPSEISASAHQSISEGSKSAPTSGGKPKKKPKKGLIANIAGTRYECVRESLENCGFACVRDERDDPNCLLYWSDLAVPNERISEMKPYQKINHFPGMGEVCRKDALARNMMKIQKFFPNDYDFVPKTWNMPLDGNSFLNYVKESGKKRRRIKTFIAKPSNGAMGNGIRLFRNVEKAPLDENYIIQEYLDKPMLIDGFKFDMRVYVLVTSCDPLKVFLFRDGLVRISTKSYVLPNDQNIEELYMHLTNYSVNKFSATYEKDEDESKGSKRNFEFLNDWLTKGGYDTQKIWREIGEVIVKTLLVAEPHLIHQYRMCRPGVSPLADSTCFEILGFDIFLDRKGKPWLLEINRSPSFGTNERIDLNIKSSLLQQSFKLLRVRASDKKRCLNNQKLESQRRLFNGHRRLAIEQWDKSKAAKVRRREQLQIQLAALRRESIRQEYESKNLGKFRKIFPIDDRVQLEQYITILSKGFDVLLAGRGGQLQKEIISNYKNPYHEADLLDLIEQCECEENGEVTTYSGGYRKPPVPKTLSSMPSSSSPLRKGEHSSDDSDDDDNSEASDDNDVTNNSNQNNGNDDTKSETHTIETASTVLDKKKLTRKTKKASFNNRSQKNERPTLVSRSSTRSLSSLRFESNRNLPPSKRKKDDSDLIQLYDALSELNIKFPGKSDEEATEILNSILDNWRYHKPRVASYWLVKLDSAKRQKVVDIVRNNVRSIIQRFYESEDIDKLNVTKCLNKVFSRMLWSHGQGLWSCLNHTTRGPAPWESIFRNGVEMLSNVEMGCCKIAVELCKDCLLVVYQFANQSRSELNLGTNSVSTATVIPGNSTVS
ncbi:tubulin polyglutamylase TTLL7-like [Convolutriloba macropyga]|uniref:tubulin polyglutamylase TTLL7-like n=1 Tax=Convolutriloba macropyga TaxID=536237 RepID=UPI003F5216C6